MEARESKGTVSYLAGKMTKTPSIKIGGDWLAEQGFAVGDKLLITTHEGEIVIRKETVQV